MGGHLDTGEGWRVMTDEMNKELEAEATKALETAAKGETNIEKVVAHAEAAQSMVSATPKKHCTFPGCGKGVIARGLCVSHYRQELRNKPLKPLRPFRGLVRLPMVIRVEKKTLDALQKRVDIGKAASMYDSTRQALEVGIMLLEAMDNEKKSEPVTAPDIAAAGK